MGYKRVLDYSRICHELYIAGVELHDDRNDGYTQWEIKQDLYRIKWLIDNILSKSPNFDEIEDEFLEKHEKAVLWKELKS